MLPTMHYIVTDTKRRNRFAIYVAVVIAVLAVGTMLLLSPTDDDAAVHQYLKEHHQLMEGK